MTATVPPTIAAPRRIAFCITELDPGGAERALFETATRLDRESWHPRIFCLGPRADLTTSFENAGISVVCLNAHKRHLLRAIRQLRSALREFEPEVLATSLFHANLVGRLAARPLGFPVIASHRVAERQSRWHIWLERLTGRLVDHHLAVSEAVKAFLVDQRVAAESEISVIYNGVDFERFATAEPAIDDHPGPIVLFAGRLHHQKGIEILFEAWPRVVAQHPTAKLVLAGRGPLEAHVRQYVADHQSVNFLGHVVDLAPWYRRADLVVLPSLWEGLPNVLLESLAAGTPCIVSDVEGVREVVNGENQLVVPANDPDTLKSRLVDALAHPDVYTTCATNAQAYVKKHFTWINTAENTSRLLQRYCRQKPLHDA